MNVAFAFVGFIRDYCFIENYQQFINKILDSINCEVTNADVYYSSPHLLREFDEHSLDQNYVRYLIQKNCSYESVVEFRNYDPYKYVKKCIDNNLPFITKLEVFPNRVLSFIDGISETSKLIDSSKYDLVIYTRFDILHMFEKLGTFDTSKPNVYALRNNHGLDCEDRLFYGTPRLVDLLVNFYDQILNTTVDLDNFYTERLMGGYLRKYESENFILNYQKGVDLPPGSPYYNEKYTEHTLSMYKKLFENYKNK